MEDQRNGAPKMIVEPAANTKAKWINQPYISARLREDLELADALFVPATQFREQEDHPLFPEGTEALFRYVQDAAPEGVKVDICIEDENYKELALHFAVFDLGCIIVTLIVAPVIAQLIANYIQKRIDNKRDEQVKFELIVTGENGKAARIFYEGPADQFNTNVLPAVQNLRIEPQIQPASLSPTCMEAVTADEPYQHRTVSS